MQPEKRRGTAAAQVRDRLREAILHGEYLPGERLVEAQLIERFAASRFNVRAALRDLAAEGLVRMERNRGAHVRKVSIEQAVEITEVRHLGGPA
ncbi:GntR family transcriptional regulator [Actinoplanes sp. NPDC048796]|uniref:GntR family transcriptional regulator n=1 Tax=Actinoplanes sp. NPDC048796 TaxID=3155640 RepID=UPI0034119138